MFDLSNALKEKCPPTKKEINLMHIYKLVTVFINIIGLQVIRVRMGITTNRNLIRNMHVIQLLFCQIQPSNEINLINMPPLGINKTRNYCICSMRNDSVYSALE